MKISTLFTESMKPSSPTPPHLREFKLSFIDERIPPSYIPLILYYTSNKHNNINQSQMSNLLKTSLSQALAHFYPLAGRMKGQISVDCNDHGVFYVQARANGNVLDIVNSPDPQVLDNLIPFITNGYVSSSQEQLAVQKYYKSRPDHLIQLRWNRCWNVHFPQNRRRLHAELLHQMLGCNGSSGSDQRRRPRLQLGHLFPPRNTPDFAPNPTSPSVRPLARDLDMRRFVFTSSAIDALKLEVAGNSTLTIIEPTRVEVVTAFIWNRCMAAKGIERSVAYHSLNLRGKVPALSESSFGNLFQMVKAESAGETSWIQLVGKLRAAFEKFDDQYMMNLLGEKGFELGKENFMEISRLLLEGNVEVFRFSSYCRFAVYEADFGWGRPVWVSNGSYQNKNCVFLFDSADRSRGIEAWIVMRDQEMKRLQQDSEFLRFASG